MGQCPERNGALRFGLRCVTKRNSNSISGSFFPCFSSTFSCHSFRCFRWWPIPDLALCSVPFPPSVQTFKRNQEHEFPIPLRSVLPRSVPETRHNIPVLPRSPFRSVPGQRFSHWRHRIDTISLSVREAESNRCLLSWWFVNWGSRRSQRGCSEWGYCC